MNNRTSLAKGTVKGVASDIEKWIRDYAEHTPIVKESRGSDDQFTLTLYKYFFGRNGGGPSKPPYAQVKVTGWSNGTTDVHIWTIPADQSYYDREQEDKDRHSDMADMSADLLKRFPYVGAQAAQSAETSKADELNISGGVNVDADNVTVGNDVVGRDKIIQYIEHATIIQPLPHET